MTLCAPYLCDTICIDIGISPGYVHGSGYRYDSCTILLGRIVALSDVAKSVGRSLVRDLLVFLFGSYNTNEER